MSPSDTIAAIATASAAGGIGVVRISGPASAEIARNILGACPAPRYAAYRSFMEVDGSVIDRGIAIYYKAPHSYTGEDVLELQGHGGTALMQLLLARCITLGARQAEPGEFTRRAYLSGKLDLAQAEAVADVINAATAEAARSAVRSLAGEFSSHVNRLLSLLVSLRMYVEACLDFPEEEIDFISQGNIAQKLSALEQELASLFMQARQGNLLREGMHVVLVGQPNVGKSSLMNQLAGEDVAIVTAMPGTTRDTIKNMIQINGIPLHIVDTAGLRDTQDEIERQGIARTWRSLENADIAIIMLDATLGIGAPEKTLLKRFPAVLPKLWVHNKIDLASQAPAIKKIDGEMHVYLSAKSGAGLDLLRTQLLALIGWQTSAEGVFMARSRHIQALQAAQLNVSAAGLLLAQPELLAEELRLAQESLSSITGEFTPDDLLGEIFSRFCIGK